MKKFSSLTPDQRKMRKIILFSIMIGISVFILFLIDHIKKGNHIDLTLFGAAIILGLGSGIGAAVAIIIALMPKDRVL